MSQPAQLVCQICKKSKSPNSGMIAELIRPSLLEFIKKKVPDLDAKAFICFEDLGEFRKDYVKEVLEDEIGELSALDQEVIESLEQHEILSSDIIKQFERKLTFGERLSDQIAEFGGSWKFLITFGAVILIWIGMNCVMLATRAFDPYPFILLNLVLSCLAAVQAPVIMMSQNRSEARDRLRAENDYKVNLKAELEIRHLHEKLDHLLRRQYNRLFEIQQIQIELLQEIGQKKLIIFAYRPLLEPLLQFQPPISQTKKHFQCKKRPLLNPASSIRASCSLLLFAQLAHSWRCSALQQRLQSRRRTPIPACRNRCV